MKNNFLLTNLQEHSSRQKDLLSFIERCFQYEKSNSFLKDFAPLFSEDNFKNLFFIIEEKTQEIIAHAGALNKKLFYLPNSFEDDVILIGGVCTHESFRGQGLSSLLLDHIHQQFSSSLFFILWSEKNSFYEKFNYYEVGQIFQTGSQAFNHHSSYSSNNFLNISDLEKEQIKKLYLKNANSFLTLKREEKDWRTIEKMSSTKLFFKKNGDTISHYFFYEKGQDLHEIIHELSPHSLENILPLSMNKVWTPIPFENYDEIFYNSLIRIGSKKKFSKFLEKFLSSQFLIKDLSTNSISFSLNSYDYQLEIKALLQGIWGPNFIEEFSCVPTLYFTGMDSI